MDKLLPLLSARNRTVFLLLSGALGAVLFICAAAIFFYKNTQQLMTVHRLEEHSQLVLNLLEMSAQRMERMDYLSRLYLSEKTSDDLNTVRATAAQLDTSLAQLESFIWDNNQRNRAHSAHVCTLELTEQVNSLFQQSSSADKMSITRKMLECRDIISQMEVQEENLLKHRTDLAHRGISWNQTAGIAFLVVSLAVVLALFGFLLRDAGQRIETEHQLFQTNERLKTTVQTLENRLNEKRMLTAMRGELQLSTTPSEAYKIVVRHTAQALPDANVALLTVNSSQQPWTLELAATGHDQTDILDVAPLNSCCAIRGARTRQRKPGLSEIDCTHFQGSPPKNYICMLLAAQGEALGILYLGGSGVSGCPPFETHLDFLEGLVELGSMWIASLKLRARLEEESIRDGLTNLFNRRFMEIALERELRLAARRKSELSLLMLDIDHFKRFNDTHGHEAGDRVLRGVAEILCASVRTEDIVCRYGGEEFLVILPGMGAETSFHRAEDIRTRVSTMRLDFQGEGLKDITISIGISTYPQTGQRVEEIVRAADEALYHAKESGRNRVVIAESAVAV